MESTPQARRSPAKKPLQAGLLLGAVGAVAIFGYSHVAASDQSTLFKRDLAQGYAEVAKFAALRAHDSAAESYFQNKADRAKALYDVTPEWPTNWSIAPDLQARMTRDRQQLLLAVNRVRSGANPTAGAIAQVNYDCWVALSSVPSLGAESDRCQNAYRAAMQQLGHP